jgi:hypothetical protein
MLDLTFAITGVEPQRSLAAPQLLFQLGVAEGSSTPVHTIVLRCLVRIEPARRRYAAAEKERLLDLFDRPERWGQTVRPLVWTNLTVVVPHFTGNTTVAVPVPCCYDFNLAATRYLDAVQEGDVPLNFLFSGTVFHEAADGGLHVVPIPWDREAAYRLPVRVWKELMEQHLGNSAWLCLRKDVFDRLQEHKRHHGLPTWEHALEDLLAGAKDRVMS